MVRAMKLGAWRWLGIVLGVMGSSVWADDGTGARKPISLQFPPRPAASPVAPQAPEPPAPPQWMNDKVARIDFDYKGDRRKGAADRRDFEVNPDGTIVGLELLKAIQSPPREEFIKWYTTSPDAEKPSPARAEWTASFVASGKGGDPLGEFYDAAAAQKAANEAFDRLSTDEVNELGRLALKKYLNFQVNNTAARLALVRIVDNEAMKLKLSPLPSEDRVDFIVRWILVRNAIETGVECTGHSPGWVKPPGAICVKKEEVVSACGNRYRDRDGSWLQELVPAESTQSLSDAELYDALVKRVGTQPVAFKIDWQDLGSHTLGQERLQRKEPGAYPEVRLVFSRLPKEPMATCVPRFPKKNPYSQCEKAAKVGKPETLRCEEGDQLYVMPPLVQFREQIAQKLEVYQRKQIRKLAWEALVAKEFPLLAWQNLATASEQELLVNRGAVLPNVRVADQSVVFTEFGFSGEVAARAADRMEALVGEREQKAIEELFAQTPGNTVETPEEGLAKKQKILAWRSTVPKEVFTTLGQEFSKELAAGKLVISLKDRGIERKGSLVPLAECLFKPVIESHSCSEKDRAAERAAREGVEPWMVEQAKATQYEAASQWEKLDPCSSEAEMARVYLGPLAEYENQRVFPLRRFSEGTDLPSGTIRLTMLREITRGEPHVVTGDQAEVLEDSLRNQIQAKNQAWVFRDLALRLFKRNRVDVLVDTSSDANFSFPRFVAEPQAMAEALFPETFFEEKDFAQVFYPKDYAYQSSDGGYPRRKISVARTVKDYFSVRVLESDLPGRPTVGSSLGNPDLQMRVRSMDMLSFATAMAMQNPGVRPRVCPEN